MMNLKFEKLVNKVITFVNGGDEAKIDRFFTKYKKSNDEQIKLRQDDIEKFEDQIQDLREAQEETKLAISVESIKTSIDVSKYIDVYRSKQVDLLEKIIKLEDNILVLQREIRTFEMLNSQLVE